MPDSLLERASLHVHIATLRLRRQFASYRRTPIVGWEQLLREELTPILGSGLGAYRLHKEPEAGALNQDKAHIRFLLPARAGDTGYVIRWYKSWVTSDRKLRKLTLSTGYNPLLQFAGVPVPRLVWHQQRPCRAGLGREFVSVEEFVPSSPVSCSDMEQAAGTGAAFARLHAIRAPYATLPGGGRISSADFVEYCAHATLHAYMAKLAKKGARASANRLDLRASGRLLKRCAAQAVGATPDFFHMTHGDINPFNIRVDSNGLVWIVDLDSLQYDDFAFEVLKMVYGLFGPNAMAARAFWASYFRHSDEEHWHRFTLSGNFALVRLGIRLLPGLTGQVQGDPAPGTAEWLDNLCNTASVWGDSPLETDWTRIDRLLGLGQ
jgi:hypothetical protein